MNKLIAAALCLCLIAVMVPANAFAQEEPSAFAESVMVSAETLTAAAAEVTAVEPEEELSAASGEEPVEVSSAEAMDTEEELSAGTPAAEEPQLATASMIRANPLYGDGQPDATVEELMSGAVMPLSETPSYLETEFDGAAAYWREGLKNRASTIVFSYTTSEFDESQMQDQTYANAALSSLLSRMLEAAMEHTGVPNEGDYIRWHYDEYAATSSMTIYSNRTIFNITIVMTYYTTEEQEEIVAAKIEEVLNALDLEGKSDYETVCAIYDYICGHVDYDYTHLLDDSFTLKYSAYAALINGTSVCQGYANLFYYMALSQGIDTRLVPGWGNGERHGWNIVRLGTEYYCLDATWDANRPSYIYFLRGTSTFSGHTPDAEYCSDAFYARYPVSDTDYVPDSLVPTGSCGEGLTWELSKTGVLTISGSGAMEEYASVDAVPWYAYRSSITSVVIEEGVTAVGAYAFSGCTELTEITVPASVTEIGLGAFENCTNLSVIDVDGANGAYATDEYGVLFSKDMTVLYLCPGAFSGEYTVADTVTRIEAAAFADCGLTVVTVRNADCVIGEDEMTLGDPAVTVIRSPEYSTVHRYADEYGYTFQALLEGDVDDDGMLTALDITALMKCVLGMVDAETLVGADLNGDNIVDILDVIRIIRILAASAVV